MASGRVYTVIPSDRDTLDELEASLREIHERVVADGDHLFTDDYYEDAAALTDANVERRDGRGGDRLALHDIRRVPQRDILQRLTRKHPEQVAGVIRVGAETTRGSMNARMIDVDGAGEWEIVDRVRRDSYPLGGHRFTHRGVIGVNPEL